ncbi:MAG: bacillithiol biosynthesis cysteine-adding enzyme BshC [Candidatus Hydrogenedentes bacterium]|nr:bacillithiol biosynthesis cysteine-adding enzyme BshC [Candidatus Hydrogenedentota bacterium]
MKSIQADYIRGAPELAEFYAGSPRELFDKKPTAGPLYPGLCEALRAYGASIGTTALPPDGDVSAIVTGQQPVLFTGPLYTVYKAATAIRIAERLEQQRGAPCVPVFWLASDDHDFAEARTTHMLTKQHEPLALTYVLKTNADGFPMHRVPLEPSLHTLIDTMADAATGSEYRDEVRAFLHASLDAAVSFSDWSARLLARLFQGTPLLIFTTELPVMRAASAPIIEREIADPLWSSTRVNEAAARLIALGYEAQLVKGQGDCGFFLEVEGKRCKVVYEQGAFVLPSLGWRYSADELLNTLAAEPERFSPNAALRSVVQQRLFPVHAYVGGPGEIAYWGQFKPLFDNVSAPMPVVYPRAQVRLSSTKLNKLLTRCGLNADDFSAPLEQIEEKALATAAAGPALEALARCRAEIAQSVGILEQTLSTVKAPPLAVGDRVFGELDKARRTLERADSAKVETVRQNVMRLANTFAPWRKPQERVYTVFSFLFEHGWDLVPRIIREIDIDSFTTGEIEL